MGMPDRDEVLMAYLDGELGAGEAAALDARLTPSQRARMEGESRFEAGLSEILRGSSSCPAALWERTLADLERAGTPRAKWQVAPLKFAGLAALAAAIWAIGIGIYMQYLAPPEPEQLLVMRQETVLEFATHSVTLASTASVQAFLDDNRIDLELFAPSNNGRPGNHAVQLLGARHEKMGKVPVTSILFACCGQPTKLLVFPKCCQMAKRMVDQAHVDGTDARECRKIGKYSVVLVSKHSSSLPLDFLRPKPVAVASADSCFVSPLAMLVAP